MIDSKESLRDRFIKYTAFDTMSNDSLGGVQRPTTAGQVVLLEYLKKELDDLGLDTYFGEESVVMATLKGNDGGKNTIGFMAHVDTADACEGNHVKAQVWSNYDGKDIALKDGVVLTVEENPDLLLYKGGEVITSDGTTLLGSDDKAGVAIIMEMLKYYVENPSVKHPTIEVYFTPDEETGTGMDKFPHDRLQCSCCYTVDGGPEGEVEVECFNAATVNISIHGYSIHLGSGRGKLVNAVTLGAKLISLLPQAESPEATDGRYGYYCPLTFSGNGLDAKLQVFIREFDRELFEKKIAATEAAAKTVEMLYGGTIKAETSITYRNMVEANGKNPKALAAVYASAKAMDLPLKEEIIRGGTDGARLAETGVSCPNLFTGGHNLHSVSEWVAVDAMNRSMNLCLGIADYWTEK